MEPADAELDQARERLVNVVRESVSPGDARILEALRRVPRHLFVPRVERAFSYDDRALPIGGGQTISQPSMIAIMLDALECEASSRVLEVGAGSGYAAALLSLLAREVDAVEIRPDLAARAEQNLASANVKNVRVHVRDGWGGLPERAPFDRILVSAAPDSVPEALVEQLALGGRIAVPVGDDWSQQLVIGVKDASGRMHWRKDVPCVFVPLVHGRP